MLRTEDVRIRDHREWQDRIFIPALYLTVADHDLPRNQVVIVVLRVEAAQPFVKQILRQPLCTASRTGKQYDAVAVLAVALQVLHQKFKAAVVCAHALYMDRKLSV